MNTLVNGPKVGDILYSSWGYDQTNGDFYQMVEVKTRAVVIKPIVKRRLEQNAGFMSAYVLPIKDAFVKDAKPMLRLPEPSDNSYCLKIDDYEHAWLWDG